MGKKGRGARKAAEVAVRRFDLDTSVQGVFLSSIGVDIPHPAGGRRHFKIDPPRKYAKQLLHEESFFEEYMNMTNLLNATSAELTRLMLGLRHRFGIRFFIQDEPITAALQRCCA